LGEVTKEGFFGKIKTSKSYISSTKPKSKSKSTHDDDDDDDFNLLEFTDEMVGGADKSVNKKGKKNRRDYGYSSSDSDSDSEIDDFPNPSSSSSSSSKSKSTPNTKQDSSDVLTAYRAYRHESRTPTDTEKEADDRKRRRTTSTTSSATPPPPPPPLRIIYAARTHSQLSQFVKEVRSTYWGGGGTNTSPSSNNSNSTPQNPIRLVTIGSRSNGGCQNENVLYGTTTSSKSKFKRSEETIRETCLKLMEDSKSKKKTSCAGCEFLGDGNMSNLTPLTMGILSTPLPLNSEEGEGEKDSTNPNPEHTPSIAELSKAVKLCGYYAAKAAVPGAEVVVTSYQNLFGGGSYFSDELSYAEKHKNENIDTNTKKPDEEISKGENSRKRKVRKRASLDEDEHASQRAKRTANEASSKRSD